MKHEVPLWLRVLVPAGALVGIMKLPLSDSFFGGNPPTMPAVYDMIGDADGSGTLGLGDVQAIRQVYLENAPYDDGFLKVADLNGDGKITAEDAGILLRFLADENAPDVTPDVYYRILIGQEGTQ